MPTTMADGTQWRGSRKCCQSMPLRLSFHEMGFRLDSLSLSDPDVNGHIIATEAAPLLTTARSMDGEVHSCSVASWWCSCPQFGNAQVPSWLSIDWGSAPHKVVPRYRHLELLISALGRLEIVKSEVNLETPR